MRFQVFLAIVVAGAGFSARSAARERCADPLTGELTYATLRQYIEQRRVESIDELLPCLPSEYRGHFTLVYRSRSAERDAVSAIWPRIVLFGRDARLLLAMTGDPAGGHHDRLQAIQFEDAGARFAFHEIVFAGRTEAAGVAAAPAVFHDQPPRCAECHGADGRPVWESYALWPGIYGSANDEVAPGTAEREGFDRFARQSRRRGRYAALFWPRTSRVAPYHEEMSFGSVEEFPNLRLSKLLVRHNAKRIFRKVKTAPRYEQARFSVASGLLGCEPFPVPGGLGANVLETVRRGYRAKLARMDGRSSDPVSESSLRYTAEGAARAARAGEIFGVDVADWPMTLEPGSFDFHDGDATMDDFLLTELLRELARDDPRIAPFLRVVNEGAALQRRGFGPDGPTGGKYRYGAAYTALFDELGGAVLLQAARGACALIRGRGAADGSVPPDAPPPPEEALALGPGSAAGNPLERHCGGCHSAPAPALRVIPFADPDRLRALLARNQGLARDMHRRLRSPGRDRMPPHGLPEPEVAGIEAYLQGLLRVR